MGYMIAGAILEYYAGLPHVSAQRIGVVGHSQGGWVAQRLAATNREIDFAISLVGPVTTLGQQDLSRVRILLECEGCTGADLERGMQKRERTHQMWRNLGGWFPFFELGFMHNNVDDSTLDDLRSVRIPFLLSFDWFQHFSFSSAVPERFGAVLFT